MPFIRALGTWVNVILGDAIDPDEFARAWSRCLTGPSDGPPARSSVFNVGPRPTMTSLTQAITSTLIHRRAGQLLMLHAGAVCNPRTGASIAYAAPGGTGKTTLTRLLGQRYGYLTDETVGVEPGSWRILSYEKPLSLRNPEGGYPKREVGPDELGLVGAHPDPRLAALAVLRRRPHMSEASITRLDAFDAITALVPETSSLYRLERPLHLLADLEAELGGIWLLEYSEVEQLTHWASQHLGRVP